MSQCRKFAPNIFHKSKCSNCFRQKEEHTAEALECNRASRSIARSGYLFVAPDWDFSVPLNRTKRWQRRWFVLYDDGELNYSVDEHPDTIPQGSVDMSKVLEVTGAEQVTGHPHSLALTSPDRVTFVKAASREDARWWAELLAVFPRRHKRNATFPGGRASPSLPQLGRSASPQPPRPRHLSVSGPSPRANFETPPLKEERESPPNEMKKDGWIPGVAIEHTTPLIRKDYVISSGSPPTRDKLRCDDKARVRRDWRNERLRDIATALTDRSPESSLALPSEGLLHLKKGWLWLKQGENEWVRRWTVLCGPTLNVYRDQDEHGIPEITVELSTVTSYTEMPTDAKYGFRIEWAGPALHLSAVTQGIRSNWMQALKMAAPMAVDHPVTPKSVLFSSDDEYRTASEGGRRESGDWSELPPSPPLNRYFDSFVLCFCKTIKRQMSFLSSRLALRARPRFRLPRCQSRQSTLDSTSTDELDGAKDGLDDPVAELQKQLARSAQEIAKLEHQIAGLKQLQSEAASREQTYQELLAGLEERNAALAQDQKMLQRSLAESRTYEDKYRALRQEWQKKKLTHDVDVDRLDVNELKDYCLELRCRLDKAVKEVRTLKLTLRRSEEDYDRLELANHSLKASLDVTKREHQSEVDLLVSRLDYLTAKLNRAEKARRRSLNLEDKVGELEAKMSSLEDRRTVKRRLRRFRRKSLDGGETGRKFDREELEESLRELQVIVGGGDEEVEVVRRSVGSVVDQLQQVLLSKLQSVEGEEGQLGRVAEKMAFERIIIGRIQQALEGPSSRLAEKEARETGHLIVALEKKLQGQTPATLTTAKTSAAYLTKILTKYFISLGQGYQSLKSITLKPQSPSLQSLLEQQRKIHEMYRNYQEKKLTLLTGHLDSLTDLTSQIARGELIKHQLGQALLKAARTYQAHFDSDQSNCFAFYASERAALELWSDSVAVCLRQEIDNAVASLAERVPRLAHDVATPTGELHEFADVVAHKALIDARIDVLTGRFKDDLTQNEDGLVRSWFDRQRYLEELRDEPGLVGADLEAEFLCMLDQSLAALGGFDEVMEQTKELQTRLDEFRRVVDCDGADLALIDNWNDVCQKCQTLHDSLEKMRRLIGNGGPIRRSDSQKDQRTHLGTEYLTQVEQLRAAYRYALASCKERHQMADIEQLQLLCDKVLNSMDQWHRRTIQQMRQTHAHEVEQLRQEKEQALAEETQATLAALDAMRKAHVAEVQREVARFKQEYARQQRDEIVDLSERLSVKSLEAAALEEQLGSATRQLAQAQQRILHLERNPQLSSMQN